mmetsp:Transcript_25093/g.70895  ORF Transcript_25093/g.70895 Transcript_25093/m.70895 type:complete len:246 (-) Transcript_25093:266-1003(-)
MGPLHLQQTTNRVIGEHRNTGRRPGDRSTKELGGDALCGVDPKVIRLHINDPIVNSKLDAFIGKAAEQGWADASIPGREPLLAHHVGKRGDEARLRCARFDNLTGHARPSHVHRVGDDAGSHPSQRPCAEREPERVRRLANFVGRDLGVHGFGHDGFERVVAAEEDATGRKDPRAVDEVSAPETSEAFALQDELARAPSTACAVACLGHDAHALEGRHGSLSHGAGNSANNHALRIVCVCHGTGQ